MLIVVVTPSDQRRTWYRFLLEEERSVRLVLCAAIYGVLAAYLSQGGDQAAKAGVAGAPGLTEKPDKPGMRPTTATYGRKVLHI